MSISKKAIVKTAGILSATSALAGATAYFTTRFLVKTAINREEPKIMEKAGDLISGTLVEEEVLKRQKQAAEKLAAARTETVKITSYDGVELAGHWYTCEKPERIVIAMHGWRSSWCNDFGLVSDFLHENHCNVLFAEQRGQNNSGGDYIGFGVTERHDCLEWIRWVMKNDLDELPIYLCGVSMGATTVLMTAGLEMPKCVHGIMADCGFTSPDEIWRHIANNNLHLTYHLRRTIARNIYERKNEACKFDYSTVDALRTSRTPVLLIHGTEDHFVPVEMTYRNYMACSAPKRLLIVPGADHGMSYLMDKAGYETAVRNFWQEFDAEQAKD